MTSLFSTSKRTTRASLNKDPHFPPLTRGQTAYAGIVALLAWTFAVYDLITFGNLLPLIQDDFGWSSSYTSYVTTLVQLGALIVAFCVGPVIDLLGRRFALTLTTGGAALSCGLSALAFGPISLVLFRMLSGFGMSEQAVNSAYLNEIFKPKTKGLLYSIIQAGWPLGVMLSAGLAALLTGAIGWRGVFLVALSPLLVIFILRLFLKESPYFLKVNHLRKLVAHQQMEDANRLSEKWSIQLPGKSINTYKELFHKRHRKHSSFIGLTFFFKMIADSQTTILATLILVNVKGIELTGALWTVVVGNAIALVGYLFLGWIGDLMGRRITVLISQVLVGVCIYMLVVVAQGQIHVIVWYSAILFFAQGAAAPFFTYVGESFPSKIRGSGAAYVNILGPLGAVMGPLLFGALQTFGLSATQAALSGAVAAILSALMLLGCRSIKSRQEIERLEAEII